MLKSASALKIGLVGCGQHSHEHFNAAQQLNDVEIVSCCDVKEENASLCAEKYGCASFYADMGAMLANERLDAVILCTWPNQHAEQIKTCLDAGVKNILCEKSLAVSSQEALCIWNMAASHSAFIMEACKYRHHPAIKRLEELAAETGRVDSLRAVFSNYEPEALSDADFANDWRFKKECGGGVAYDWMSYCVNGCNHFSGSSPKVIFASGTIGEKSGVITRAFAQIEYENGVTAFIESSKEASFSEGFEINCAGGRIFLPITWGIYGEVEIRRTRRKPEWPYILNDRFEIGEQNEFVLQLQNFADVITKGVEPVMPLNQSIINVSTIDAIVNSIETGVPQNLNFRI